MEIGIFIFCISHREEYEETLMNQRKMFDDEIEEITSQHSHTLHKLSKLHSDDKSKLEQLLQQHKANPDNVGGTKKDAARCLEKCMKDSCFFVYIKLYLFLNISLFYVFSEPMLVNMFTCTKHVPIPTGKVIFRVNQHLSNIFRQLREDGPACSS